MIKVLKILLNLCHTNRRYLETLKNTLAAVPNLIPIHNNLSPITRPMLLLGILASVVQGFSRTVVVA